MTRGEGGGRCCAPRPCGLRRGGVRDVYTSTGSVPRGLLRMSWVPLYLFSLGAFSSHLASCCEETCW